MTSLHKLGMFLLLIAGALLVSSTLSQPHALAKADPDELPDTSHTTTPNNSNFFNGVVSTGTIGRYTKAQTGGKEVRNDFYGPEMWAKIYSADDTSHTLVLDFVQQGDARRDFCDADHEAKFSLQFYKGQADGSRGAHIDGKDKDYTSLGGCSDFLNGNKTITINKGQWPEAADKETTSGKYVVFVRITMWEQLGGGLWVQTPGSATPDDNGFGSNHLEGSPNHPVAEFHMRSAVGSKLVFGANGIINKSEDDARDYHYYCTGTNQSLEKYCNRDSNNSPIPPPNQYAYNTHALGYNRIRDDISSSNGDLKREFEFSPKCSYFKAGEKSKNVWLRWFDDDVDLSKPEATMVMEVWEHRNSDNNDNWNRIKVISGFNENPAVEKRWGHKNKDGTYTIQSNWLQRNLKPGNQDFANPDGYGEGFGGKGQPGRMRITVKSGYSYRWVYKAANSNVNGSRYGNKLAIYMPFDTAFDRQNTCGDKPDVAYACWPIIDPSPDRLQRGDAANVIFGIFGKKGTPQPATPPNYTIPGAVSGPSSYVGATPFYGGFIWTYRANIGANKLNQARPYSITWATPDTIPCSGNFSVSDYPFFKAFGSAIRAGGQFASTEGSGTTNTYPGDFRNKNGWLASWYNTDQKAGASTNLGVLASVGARGVASSQNSFEPAPTGLTFANGGTTFPASGIRPDAFSPRLGGAFGAPENFYDPVLSAEAEDAAQDIGSSTTANIPSGTYKHSGSNVTLAASAIDNENGAGKNIKIFVKGGNVRITGSQLKYNAASWSPDKTPSFTLVVTGGNIYIDPSVTELNGIYIAKKAGNKGGNIYTCANGFAPRSKDSYFSACGQQLKVYGSFIADQIKLGRTFGTLKQASEAGAAEVFYYSPLLYFMEDINAQGSGALHYDAITSLPPVL